MTTLTLETTAFLPATLVGTCNNAILYPPSTIQLSSGPITNP